MRLPRRLWLFGFIACLKIAWFFSMVVTASAAETQDSTQRDAEILLDESSFWRFHVTLRKPTVPVVDLRAAGRAATAPASTALATCS